METLYSVRETLLDTFPRPSTAHLGCGARYSHGARFGYYVFVDLARVQSVAGSLGAFVAAVREHRPALAVPQNRELYEARSDVSTILRFDDAVLAVHEGARKLPQPTPFCDT